MLAKSKIISVQMNSPISQLSIFPDLPKIKEIIKFNPVTLIDVPTGSGKSIGIPYRVACGEDSVSIFCSQPTIAAVLGLYEYQKTLVPKGVHVGWAAEGSKNYTQNSKIVYMTAGHLRKLFLKCFVQGKALDWPYATVIMVDEVHTGSKDNSIILDLWSEMRRQGVRVPRLVMATATASGMDKMITRFKAVVFKSKVRRFPIKQLYSNKNYMSVDDDLIFEDTVAEALKFLRETQSHGLIFCSGSGECEDIAYGLQQDLEAQKLQKLGKKVVKVLPCYAQCKREQIMEAITAAPENTIHIVVATNVAESSLTIPDVAWVIDTMSEKRSSVVAGKFSLGATWISKNSAGQRAGRTGRTVKNGVCLRMMNKDNFEKLAAFRPLEICTSPIADVLIELLDVGLDPTQVITDLDVERLEEAKKELIETKCITMNSSGDLKTAKVTECGRFVAKMPMGVHTAAAFHHTFGHITIHDKEDNFFWEATALTLIDTFGPSLFWMPRKEKNEAQNVYNNRLEDHCEEYFSAYKSNSPVLSLLLGFADCMRAHSEHNVYTTPWRFGKWAREHSFNNKKLKEVCAALKRVIRTLQGFGFRCDYEEVSNLELFELLEELVKDGLSVVYGSKMLTPTFSFRGPSHMDKRGLGIVVDTNKTLAKSTPEHCYSVSEVSIENKKTGRRTIISSLWFPAPLPKSGLIRKNFSDDTTYEEW